jgi:nitrite reductase/ring-hydroxylating ferredoxin subunit
MPLMTASGEWRCAAASVPSGRGVRFPLRCGERVLDAFLVRHRGAHHAYVNRCPHVGTPLDLWPGEFFDEDGRLLLCATHGAAFEPDTGRCVAGPCAGDSLTALPTRCEDGVVVVSCRRS